MLRLLLCRLLGIHSYSHFPWERRSCWSCGKRQHSSIDGKRWVDE